MCLNFRMIFYLYFRVLKLFGLFFGCFKLDVNKFYFKEYVFLNNM